MDYPEEFQKTLLKLISICDNYSNPKSEYAFNDKMIVKYLEKLFGDKGKVDYQPFRGILLETNDDEDNELVIAYLEQTLWWEMCWLSSGRGGHYAFKTSFIK